MIKRIVEGLIVLFGIYVYPDLQALFEKAGQFITIGGADFTLKFTYMGLLWLFAAIMLVIFLPKLWKKIRLIKLPCELVLSLALGYIIGFVIYLV